MKAVFVLLLLSACIWLGYEKYQNGLKIAQQEVTIQALQDQLKQQKARAAQAVSPSHRLRPDRQKSSGSKKSLFRLSGPKRK